MSVLITVVALAAVFGSLIAAIYAIPMRRTWRKENDLPLQMPGPELGPGEQSARQLSKAAS